MSEDYDADADSRLTYECWWELRRLRREAEEGRRIGIMAAQVTAIEARVAELRGET